MEVKDKQTSFRSQRINQCRVSARTMSMFDIIHEHDQTSNTNRYDGFKQRVSACFLSTCSYCLTCLFAESPGFSTGVLSSHPSHNGWA